ncbi:MAG: AbrB/MazE/SpoVT family DNA-binding domain-containing protein [Chthoniobacterales bacterium]
MSIKTKADTIRFTTKGQVVIPSWLRKEFQIEDGTRAIVTATEEGILLKPVTKRSIARLHGILKPNSGDPSFAEEWSAHKRDEKTLEDADHGLHDT